MARRLGPLVPVLLLTALLAVQLDLGRRAARLRAGEDTARQVLWTLQQRSATRTAEGGSHPGLEALLDEELPLDVLPGAAGEQQFASNATYLFALTLQTRHDATTGRTQQFWEWRAWPRDFGRSGDAEYVLTQAGELFESRNPSGRSGTERGFPPPARELELHDSGRRWWRRLADDHK